LYKHVDKCVGDSAFPVGDRMPVSSYYVFARGLSVIGGKDTIESIIGDICNEKLEENSVHIRIWVLGQLTGKMITNLFIKSCIDNTESENRETLKEFIEKPILIELVPIPQCISQ